MFYMRLFPFRSLTCLESIPAYFAISFLTRSIFYGNKAKKDNLKFLRQFSTHCWNSCLKKWPENELTRIAGAKFLTGTTQMLYQHIPAGIAETTAVRIHGAVIFSHQFGFFPPWTSLHLLSS